MSDCPALREDRFLTLASWWRARGVRWDLPEGERDSLCPSGNDVQIAVATLSNENFSRWSGFEDVLQRVALKCRRDPSFRRELVAGIMALSDPRSRSLGLCHLVKVVLGTGGVQCAVSLLPRGRARAVATFVVGLTRAVLASVLLRAWLLRRGTERSPPGVARLVSAMANQRSAADPDRAVFLGEICAMYGFSSWRRRKIEALRPEGDTRL